MSPTSPLLDRVATAPISWGVCEVPGWGIQLPVETVLGELAELGVTHPELGAIGFLPTDPIALVEVLERMGLQLLGGFVPVVLHDADLTHALKEVDGAALAVASGPEQVVEILRHVTA